MHLGHKNTKIEIKQYNIRYSSESAIQFDSIRAIAGNKFRIQLLLDCEVIFVFFALLFQWPMMSVLAAGSCCGPVQITDQLVTLGEVY